VTSLDALDALRAGLAPHYTVEREIAAGGMARVYLAHERHPRRKVAVKVMDPDVSTPAFRRRFVREVELTSSLSHPNIVPILKAEECLFVPDGPDGICYYIMPYVEGESLRERLIREPRLPLEDALAIALQVADALSYAHARGVIHRDVKPENILLSGEHAMLADFGIARAVSAARGPAMLTLPGERVGTVAYMSPEQLSASPVLDVRTDIYSLGCVLHEMLIGAPPLLDRNRSSVRGPKPLAERLRALGISRSAARVLSAAVCRALEGEPGDRFATVDELAAELRRVPPSADRVATARKGNVVMAASVALMVLIVLGLLWLRRGPALDPNRVALAGFGPPAADSSLAPVGDAFAGWVTQGVSGRGPIEVVSEPVRGQIGRAKARALARRAGAGLVVVGSFYREADSIRFQLQVLDGADGTVTRALDPVAAPVSAPSQAAEPIRRRIGLVLDTLRARR
jgi:eukaryotic-like serine/threonine-protein kinase